MVVVNRLGRTPSHSTGFSGAAHACVGKAPEYAVRRMDSQLTQYLPVLILLMVATGFAASTLVISVVVGKFGRRTPTKDIPYECGMLPQGEGSARMSVKFYLVALLFVLFDIEVVFMYPWAVVYKEMLRENAALILGGMVSFLGILFAGYLYALKKGALEWSK
jgi:NADH-quinone oxidoreductase subunit A